MARHARTDERMQKRLAIKRRKAIYLFFSSLFISPQHSCYVSHSAAASRLAPPIQSARPVQRRDTKEKSLSSFFFLPLRDGKKTFYPGALTLRSRATCGGGTRRNGARCVRLMYTQMCGVYVRISRENATPMRRITLNAKVSHVRNAVREPHGLRFLYDGLCTQGRSRRRGSDDEEGERNGYGIPR